MKLDDEITLGYVTIYDWDPTGQVARIASMGVQLRRYESFVSRLGVADVTIARLPNATKVNIDYNDAGVEPDEFFIAEVHEAMLFQSQLAALLHKYLDPYLED